jgi:hypothetical protein
MTYQPPPPTAPIPVAPLQWPEAPPVRRGKPGLITAMGIISIIVACMSGFANFVLTFVAVAMLAGSRGPAVWTPPAPPVQVAPVGPTGATAVVGGLEVDPSQSEDGIHDENLRPMVIAGMTRARALDDGRRKQLDLLLMVAGRSIFPFISPGTQPQTIRANVSDSGRLPSAAAGKKGPDYFIVGTGRVEVYDTHAIFRPDGSPNVASVSVPTGDGSADGSANAPGQPPPATTVPPPPPPMPPMVNPMASLNKTAATVSMIEAIIAMLVAVYLLIIGIVTLRDSRAGGRLHWIYVAVKIPLAIVMVVAYSMVASSLVAGANAAAAATPGAPAVAAGMGAMATFWVVMLGLAAFAYPLALVPVLLTKTVRKYYSPARYD